MAVTAFTGFNSQQNAGPEGENMQGTFSYSTAIKRSGISSVRLNPASGVTGYIGAPGMSAAVYAHWAIRVESMPTVGRVIADNANATHPNLFLNTDGTISLRDSTTVIGTTSTAISTGLWYWIGIHNVGGATGVLFQFSADDGTLLDQISGTMPANNMGTIGMQGTEASAIDMYVDDYVADGAGFLTNAKIAFVRPVSDGTRVAWTAGAGGTTNLWQALDNQPPVGLASANETNTSNVESASNTGTANYTANFAAYDTLGIVAADTILAIQVNIVHGEDIAPGTKTGSYELLTNPSVAADPFTFGNDTGAHGAELGAWAREKGTLTVSPALTLSAGPTVKLIKTDTTTRVGCVDYLAINVAYTPATAAGQVPYVNPMPQLLAQ